MGDDLDWCRMGASGHCLSVTIKSIKSSNSNDSQKL